jgi:hypothetical protein
VVSKPTFPSNAIDHSDNRWDQFNTLPRIGVGKMKTLHQYVALITILVFSVVGTTGCAKKVVIHPGSISNLDSYAFDLLLVEQATLTQAKLQWASGQLPASIKGPLNIAIDQYNVTENAWQTYHGTGGSNEGALQQALTTLVTVMGDLAKLLPNSGLKPVKSSELRICPPTGEVLAFWGTYPNGKVWYEGSDCINSQGVAVPTAMLIPTEVIHVHYSYAA